MDSLGPDVLSIQFLPKLGIEIGTLKFSAEDISGLFCLVYMSDTRECVPVNTCKRKINTVWHYSFCDVTQQRDLVKYLTAESCLKKRITENRMTKS